MQIADLLSIVLAGVRMRGPCPGRTSRKLRLAWCAILLTIVYVTAAAHRHTVDTAMVVQNTSTCLTGRKVADERSVTITEVHQRFVGSSRVYVRAREAVYVLVLAYAAAQQRCVVAHFSKNTTTLRHTITRALLRKICAITQS